MTLFGELKGVHSVKKLSKASVIVLSSFDAISHERERVPSVTSAFFCILFFFTSQWRSSALLSFSVTMASTTKEPNSQILTWSEIDKFKFFGFGTGLYSALTLALHPMTVLKTRQQVLNNSTGKDSLAHQHTIRSTFKDLMASSGVRGLFRGAGVVVSLAIPARVLYITTLEVSREQCQELLDSTVDAFYPNHESRLLLEPLSASVAGGVAGGTAAIASQCLVVPMDVVSQRQMVMDQATFATKGSAWSIMSSAVKEGGWRALYRGFGLSLFSSLPAGSVWWATYGGCQHLLDQHWKTRGTLNEWEVAFQRIITQLLSGTSAALVAATLTQPLDVTRTRLQVQTNTPLSAIVSELKDTSGLRGFYRGLGPRVTHMAIWGTVLSSAYELLRHISRA